MTCKCCHCGIFGRDIPPRERFQLILAAAGRGDDVEHERLVRAQRPLHLRMPDHAPWAHAYDEVAMMFYLELLDDAAAFDEAYRYWLDLQEICDKDEVDDAEDPDGEDDEDALPSIAAGSAEVEPEQDFDEAMQTDHRYRYLYLAMGWSLTAKLAGWKLFSQRLSIDPYTRWFHLPGFARFERLVQRLESNQPNTAFDLTSMLRWVRSIGRQCGDEPQVEHLMTAERYAADLEEILQRRAAWWGGEP